MLIGGLILLAIAVFMKSAFILFPWTIAATVLAALSGIGLGKLLGRSRGASTVVSVASSVILTFAFGYLGYWLLPPTAPPQKQGLEALLAPPEPSQQDLQGMFPIHLGISAVLGALVVGMACYRRSLDLELRRVAVVEGIPKPRKSADN